jgi:biotin transport system substrate-specific component
MPASVRTLTLADAALPRADFFRNALLVVGASLATGLAAQAAIPLPWTPVPLTGQSFAVLLTGMALGSRRGSLALALYLAEGAAGLPVFAGGGAGPAALVGPTGGYLLAFPLAAAMTGYLAERGWDRRGLTTLAAMLIGSVVIFAGGLAGLARFVPPAQLLGTGLLPFIPGDVVKASLAALAFPFAWSWVNRRSGIDA